MDIFEMFYDDKQNLDFVYHQINNRNFQILPETISTGPIFKILFESNLAKDGYEKGFLVIPKGSSIKEHTHIEDIEEYNLLTGNLSIKGENMNKNRCFNLEKHSIDHVSEFTVIKTIKIKNELISNLQTKAYKKTI